MAQFLPVLLNVVLNLLFRGGYLFLLAEVGQQLVHFQHGFDAFFHVHFLLDDVLDFLHDVDQVVDRVRTLADVVLDLFHLIRYFFDLVLGFVVEFTHETLPVGVDDFPQFGLELVGRQAHCPDLVHLRLFLDLFFFSGEFCQFLLLLLHGWIDLFFELLDYIVRIALLVVLPCFDFSEFIFDFIFGPLNRTC